MNILGIIPARGGSKGIPQKNIALLGGKPLIGWTIEAALKSRMLTRTIVSTDSEEIASAARAFGAEVPFMRPMDIASDSATGLAVMRHAIEVCSREKPVDIIVYLQPTSPFRRAADIDAAVEILLGSQADGVVSVVRVPHHMLPECQMELQVSGELKALQLQASLDRHHKRLLYARNGPAVLALRAEYVKNCQSLYEGRLLPLCMNERESVDIDTPEDLQLAEQWIKITSV